LRAEREQGITIDVAYKYFSTPSRKFIIADAPGHTQYTRNMVTGASNSDLIIILVDARNGVSEQTRRHSIIASLLNLPHVVVAINKMDLVANSQDVYNDIVIDYSVVAATLGLKDITYIPISAINGDNIVEKSPNFPWYEGESLLHILENVAVANDINYTDARFPVQYVIRPQTEELHDYRGYAGKVISGIYKKGDKITVQPSGLQSTISAIEIGGKEVDEAFAPQSVVLHLQDDIDISRGDVIVQSANQPSVENELDVLLCWMGNKPLKEGNKYLLQINSRVVKAVVKEIEYKLDVNSLLKEPAPEQAQLNDIIKVKIKTASPIPFDSYKKLRVNGGAILIDETSNVTVGACMIQ
jgi:sulfate adenylyltransferase subunit 1